MASSTGSKTYASPGTQGPAGPPGNDMVTLGSLYRPPVGMHPTATTEVRELGNLAGFNNGTSFYAYDDAGGHTTDWWNKQGSTWVKPQGATMTIAATTTRVYRDQPTVPMASSGELEFLYHGKGFALLLSQQGDPLVDVVFGTVEEDGTVYRLPDQNGAAVPGSGFRQYHWNFPNKRPRKIRLFLPVGGWHSIVVESNDEVGYAPDRPLVPVVSDSYADAAGWGRYSWTKEYQILTGFRVHEGGVGSTGWFNNGAGQNSEQPGDDQNMLNRFYYFHATRLAKLAAQALGPVHQPLFMLTNGSGNDGAWSTSMEVVRDRVLQGMDRVQAYDPDCKIVSVSWEPVSVFSGQAQQNFDAGMAAAHAQHPMSAGVVFPCNDHGRKWFSGGGTTAQVPTPSTSESQFVGADAIHLEPTGLATNYYAQRIAESTRSFKVSSKRAKL